MRAGAPRATWRHATEVRSQPTVPQIPSYFYDSPLRRSVVHLFRVVASDDTANRRRPCTTSAFGAIYWVLERHKRVTRERVVSTSIPRTSGSRSKRHGWDRRTQGSNPSSHNRSRIRYTETRLFLNAGPGPRQRHQVCFWCIGVHITPPCQRHANALLMDRGVLKMMTPLLEDVWGTRLRFRRGS